MKFGQLAAPIAMTVLTIVALVDLSTRVMILGDAQPLFFGLVLLAWLAPAARSATDSDRTIAQVGVVAAAGVLMTGAVGDLLT